MKVIETNEYIKENGKFYKKAKIQLHGLKEIFEYIREGILSKYNDISDVGNITYGTVLRGKALTLDEPLTIDILVEEDL